MVLLAVFVGDAVSRPRPLLVLQLLIQIIFGWVIKEATDLYIALNPDVYFRLLVSLLPFFEGSRIPNEHMVRDHAAILNMTVGLVVFIVKSAGYLTHWIISAMQNIASDGAKGRTPGLLPPIP